MVRQRRLATDVFEVETMPTDTADTDTAVADEQQAAAAPDEKPADEGLQKDLAELDASQATEAADAAKAADAANAEPDAEAEKEGAGKPKEEAKAEEGAEKPPAEPPKDGADEGADDTTKLTPKQEAAVKWAGMDPESVFAMGEAGIALADKLVQRRSETDQLAGKVGNLRQQIEQQGGDDKGGAEEAGTDTADGSLDELQEVAAEDWDEDDEDGRPIAGGKLLANQAILVGIVRNLQAGASAKGDSDESAQAQQRAAEYDKCFADLDAKDWTQFGEGPMADLTEGSAEADARYRVSVLTEGLMASAEENGHPIPREEAFQAALAAAHPEAHRKAVERAAAENINKARRGSPESPTGRRTVGTPPTPEEEAQKGLTDDLTELATGGG